MDTSSETFVMHIAIQKRKKMPVHLEKKAQVGALIFDKAPTVIQVEYSDYSDVF